MLPVSHSNALARGKGGGLLFLLFLLFYIIIIIIYNYNKFYKIIT